MSTSQYDVRTLTQYVVIRTVTPDPTQEDGKTPQPEFSETYGPYSQIDTAATVQAALQKRDQSPA